MPPRSWLPLTVLSILLLLFTLPACEPRDDGSDDTGDEAGATTTGTGEVTTSGGASDPTAPSTDPSASGTTCATSRALHLR